MTEPAGITVEMRVRSRLVEPERILPDHVVDAKSALRPEALKPTSTGFHVVARLRITSSGILRNGKSRIASALAVKTAS